MIFKGGNMDCASCECISKGLSSVDWAAWVQAIGSILAVGAAILVSHLQNRNEKSREMAQATERVSDIIATTVHLAGGLIKIDQKLNQLCANGSADNAYLQLMAIEIGSINGALQGVPIWELHDFDVVETIVAIQSLSEMLKELVETIKVVNVRASSWVSQVGGQLKTVSPDLAEKVAALIALENARKIGKTD